MKKLLLKIKGMHCASCSAGITFLLKSQEGIGEVDIKWDQGGGTVEHDPAKISVEQIRDTIDQLGEYKVEKVDYEADSTS